MLVVQQTANDTVDVAFVILVVLRMRQGRGAVVDCTGTTRTVVVTCGRRVAPNTGRLQIAMAAGITTTTTRYHTHFLHGMKMFREKKFESTTVVVVVFVVGAGALLCMGMCLLY